MSGGRPTLLGGKRYALGRPLGQGGMGVVYEAFDREHERRVALKIYSSGQKVTAARARQVFDCLHGLRHPNVVELFDLFEHGDELQLAMELVEGEDFLTYCRAHRGTESLAGAGPRCDEPRLRAALPQLAAGLRAIHQRELVHRDVKPDNVRVAPDGRVVLLDFSLSREVGHETMSPYGGGTIAYMAPEQADGELGSTPAADWYGFGVMLYEALAGELPYVGPPLRVLQDKASIEAPPVRDRVADAPADLAELCDRLLAIDPGQRPTGDEVATRLGLTATAPGRIRTASTRVADERLVGRGAELAALSAALDDVLLQRARVAWVRGPAGIGKTALIDELLDQVQLQQESAVVLRGIGCSARPTAPDPFDEVAMQLSDFWRRAGVEEQSALLPRDAAPLREMFPALGRVPVMAAVQPRVEYGDDQAKRTAAFGAFRETLTQLARRRPLVLFFDAAERLPPATRTLLAELLRPPDPPPLLLLLASREHAGEVAAVVEASRAPYEVIELAPMSDGEIAEMLERRGRPAVGAAGGNPRRALRLALGSGDDAGPADDDATWLARQLERLTPAARRLLELVAVVDVPLSVEQMQAAIGFGASELAAAQEELVSAHLVRRCAVADELACDDLAREVVLAGADRARLRVDARGLAVVAARGQPTGREVLLWQVAGDDGQLCASARRAAECAETQLRFERAAAFYELAAGAAGESGKERRALETSLASMLAAGGRALEAGTLFAELAGGASTVDRPALLTRAAKLVYLAGDIRAGVDIFRRALNELGTDFARGPSGALLSLLRRRMWRRLRGLRWRERSAFELSQKQLIRGDVGLAAAYYVGLADPITGAELQARNVGSSLRLGEPRLIACAAGIETIFLAAQGAADRAAAHADLAMTIGDRLDDADIRSFATVGLAAIDYFCQGAWRSCLARLDSLDERYRAHPVMSTLELDTLQTYSCFSLLNLGEMSELSRRLFAYLREADRRGDAYAGFVYRTRLNMTWLARGDVDGARQAIEQAEAAWRPDDARYLVQHFYRLNARCELACYEGDPEAAAAVLARDEPRLRRSLLLRVSIIRLEVEMLRARIALARAARVGGAERKPLLAGLVRLQRSLRRSPLSCGSPHADLVGGCARALADDRAGAIELLRRAVDGFVDCDMGLWASAARYRLGRVLDDAEGSDSVASAIAWMGQRGVADPERMADVLAPGLGDAISVSGRRSKGVAFGNAGGPN